MFVKFIKIYGEASTINSANYVYFIALEKVLDLGHPTAGETTDPF
jgi:hypothetical protein